MKEIDVSEIGSDDLENKECEICKKPVKANDQFYFIDAHNGVIVHFICEIKKIEAEEKAGV